MDKENNDVLESLARIEAILVELRNHFIREEIPCEVLYQETQKDNAPMIIGEIRSVTAAMRSPPRANAWG